MRKTITILSLILIIAATSAAAIPQNVSADHSILHKLQELQEQTSKLQSRVNALVAILFAAKPEDTGKPADTGKPVDTGKPQDTDTTPAPTPTPAPAPAEPAAPVEPKLPAAPAEQIPATPGSAEPKSAIEKVKEQIKSVEDKIMELEKQLDRQISPPAKPAKTSAPPKISAAPELTRTLSRGASGDDVKKLQEFLAQDKSIYPEGLMTGYFGPATEAAVKRLQEKHGIETVGIVGPKTRGLLNEGAPGAAPSGLTVPPKALLARTLQRGASGKDVKDTQELLKHFPDIYPQGLATGFYGPATENAVKKLQEKLGLAATGSIDGETQKKVNELAAAVGRKQPPKISSIAPTEISVDTKVTLTGSGFTLENNSLFVKGKTILSHLTSHDGAAIIFSIPQDILCDVGQACPIKIVNSNGISNALPFKLVEAVPAPSPEPESTSGQTSKATLKPSKPPEKKETKLQEKSVSPCASTTIRPCYERETAGKIIQLNQTAGENAFSACMNSASESQRGESIQTTAVAAKEIYQYCHEGQSGVSVRKFTGASVAEVSACPVLPPVKFVSGVEPGWDNPDSGILLRTIFKSKRGPLYIGGYQNGQGKIYKSVDNGKAWTVAVLPSTETYYGSFVRRIIEDINEILYVSGSYLWKSTDGGNTWSIISQQIVDVAIGETVDDVLVSRDGSLLALARVRIEPYGMANEVHKSIDGGKTWQLILGPIFQQYAGHNFIEANDGSLIFNTLTGDMYIHDAADGKLTKTWSRTKSYDSNIHFLKTKDGAIHFVGGDPSSKELRSYKSSDSGRTWVKGGRMPDSAYLAHDAPIEASDGSLWVAAEPSCGTRTDRQTFVYRSTDKGATWTAIADSPVNEYANFIEHGRVQGPFIIDIAESEGKIFTVSFEVGAMFEVPFAIALPKAQPVTVFYPNGGETFTQNTPIVIKSTEVATYQGYTSTGEVILKGGVDIGIADETAVQGADPRSHILGWIHLNNGGSTNWDGKTVSKADVEKEERTQANLKTIFGESISLPPGRYKVIALGENEFGKKVLWDDTRNKPGNWDLSDAPFTITPTSVLVASLSITTTSLPQATVQMRYLAELQASGGVAPYTWRTFSSLPVGVTLNAATGVISGLVQHLVGASGWAVFPGTTTLTFEVTDSKGSRATKTLDFVVKGIVEKETNLTALVVGPGLAQINLSDSHLFLFPGGSEAQPYYLSIMVSDLFSPEILSKEIDVQITTDAGPKTVFVPSVSVCATHYWQFYIARDGSTYFGRKDHSCGNSDLSLQEALVPQHIARGASATPDLSAQPSSSTDLSPNSMRSSKILGAEILKVTPATPVQPVQSAPTPPPPAAPTLTNISPSIVTIGMQVTLTGTGFTTTNTVTFTGAFTEPNQIIAGIASADGATLKVTVPSAMPCKLITQCSVFVSNQNGKSNALTFWLGQRVDPVTVTSPNGGERMVQGTGITISASGGKSEALGGAVSIGFYLVKPEASAASDPTDLIVGTIPSGVSDYVWDGRKVNVGYSSEQELIYADVAPGDYKILAVGTDILNRNTIWDTAANAPGNIDLSDAPFTILSAPTPSIIVISPNGGEAYKNGDAVTITWEAKNIVSKSVNIKLFKAGTLMLSIASNVAQSAESGMFIQNWTIPSYLTPASDYTIEIFDAANSAVFDRSDSAFRISSNASLQIYGPNGGETAMRGFNALLFWTYSGYTPSSINVNLHKAGAFYRTLAAGVMPTGFYSDPILKASYPQFQYSWRYAEVPLATDIPEGDDYTIEIVDGADSSIRDKSDAPFRIISFPIPLTIKGRMVDALSGAPVPNVNFYEWSRLSFTTGTNGEFSYSTTTNPWINRAMFYWPIFNGWPSCHDATVMYLRRYADFPRTLWSGWFADLYATSSVRKTPVAVTNPVIDLGDVPMWPTADFIHTFTDIPSGFMVWYKDWSGRVSGGTGNINYTIQHGLQNTPPLGADMFVRYTDKAGLTYTSPTSRFSTDSRCQIATHSFMNGTYQWEPYPIGISVSVTGGTVGTVYNGVLKTYAYGDSYGYSAGVAPLIWDIAFGFLPPGLSLNSATGEITGTPTTAGTYAFGIKVKDANGVRASRDLTITVR